MSEYQYYEFQAIDRPLTAAEMGQLRRYSTRAQITATRFVNEYEWGEFKGDALAWMHRYFDAFFYFANWGTREFMLRLPERLIPAAVAEQYCDDEVLIIDRKGGNVVIVFELSDDTQVDELEEGSLSSLLPIRAELAERDFRALYLAWIYRVQIGMLADDEIEPPVPAGLKSLTSAQQALVDFFQIDPTLLEVAAEASTNHRAPPAKKDIGRFLESLKPAEKDRILARLMTEPGDRTALHELLRQFQATKTATLAAKPTPPRTVQMFRSCLDAVNDSSHVE